MHQVRGPGVELALHQALGLLCEHHLGAAQGERAGRGHPEEPAADDDGAHTGSHRPRQGQAVVHGAEGVHPAGKLRRARREQAAQRQDRVRSGGEHEGVVRDVGAVLAAHHALGAVDADGSGPQVGAGVAGQRDGVGAVAAREDLGEQHPVVGGVRLLADEYGGRAQAPGEPGTGEAGADHHHAPGVRRIGHARQPAGPVLTGRIPPVSHGERCAQRARGVGVRAQRLPVRWANTTTLPR